MNKLYYSNRMEYTNFQNFHLIYEGTKKKGIYLLEYHDSYLKDAFVTQVAEEFIDKGSHVLFIPEESTQYTLTDLFLSRTLFKKNPHNYPSIQQITQDDPTSLIPTFNNQFNRLNQKTKILSVNSKHPVDFIKPMFKAVRENPKIKIVILDSHTDYFHKMNLLPQLSKMYFDKNLTILFTSQVSSDKFIHRSTFIPTFLNISLYLHSQHPNLYSLTDAKDIAYDFELDVRNRSNMQLKCYFTLYPASAYCQEG